MSHYTVTVRLSADRLLRHAVNGAKSSIRTGRGPALAGSAVNSALEEIMAPYQEESDDERFIVFKDEEDTFRNEYATESVEMVELPSGKRVYTWDEQFRTPGSFGIGTNSHEPPAHLKRVEVTHASRFRTFEAFMKEWHGSEAPDAKTGRYGHWHNENGFWDWYSVGGRWTGFYPVNKKANQRFGTSGAFDNKPPSHPCSDMVHVNEIDMDHVATQTRVDAMKFWKTWSAWVESKGAIESPPFEGPRSRAIDLGLLDVVQGPAKAEKGQLVVPWSQMKNMSGERATWNDVVTLITEDQFMAEYMDAFCPITTFAALDDEGWHAPGEMGWFGCDRSETSAKRDFQKTFMGKFVRNVPTSDLLVCVDCHT